MDIVIKPATVEHLEELAPLFNDYRIFHKQSDDLEGGKLFLEERLRAKEATIYIAYNADNSNTVGYTYLYKIYSNHSLKINVILNDLYIHESYRGKGIGQMLIQMAVDYAKGIGAITLRLSAVSDNEPAKRLYEYLGFVKESGFDHFDLKLV